MKSRHAAPADSLEELAELASTAGAVVVDRSFQVRDSVEAATLIGSGKVQELAASVLSCRADAVLFDHELSPTQQRNLERALDCKVVSRTQLILDIFATRARTREGRLQVELAQLRYLLPRLAGKGVEMSRLGGGIGTRGPGETRLETDRRRIAQRIKKVERDLEGVREARAVHRKQRSAVPLPIVTLAGYTNAGKSTLFNRLASATVLADARMFATLDPTVRSLTLPSRRKVLLSDTVGFIRRLPTTLVEAFRATLEEVGEATLILHVVDVSHPQAAELISHVGEVLTEIGAAETPQLLVFNKIDRLADPSAVDMLRQRLGGTARSVAVSALTGAGIDALLTVVDEVIPFDPVVRARFRLKAGDGARLHLLHQFGRVLKTRYVGGHCEVEAEVSRSLHRRLASYALAD